MVTIGEKAPDFIAPALVGGEGRMVQLVEAIREHEAVVLYFYPADFVPECTAELVAMREADWNAHDDLTVLGLSGDSLFSHAAYAEQHDIPFSLVSDFHGSVAETYDLLLEEWEGHNHLPARAAVVIDSDWEVLAIERTQNPLDWATPPPVEQAGNALQAAGIDVEQPTVTYEQE